MRMLLSCAPADDLQKELREARAAQEQAAAAEAANADDAPMESEEEGA